MVCALVFARPALGAPQVTPALPDAAKAALNDAAGLESTISQTQGVATPPGVPKPVSAPDPPAPDPPAPAASNPSEPPPAPAPDSTAAPAPAPAPSAPATLPPDTAAGQPGGDAAATAGAGPPPEPHAAAPAPAPAAASTPAPAAAHSPVRLSEATPPPTGPTVGEQTRLGARVPSASRTSTAPQQRLVAELLPKARRRQYLLALDARPRAVTPRRAPRPATTFLLNSLERTDNRSELPRDRRVPARHPERRAPRPQDPIPGTATSASAATAAGLGLGAVAILVAAVVLAPAAAASRRRLASLSCRPSPFVRPRDRPG